jgi:hypothetical protein
MLGAGNLWRSPCRARRSAPVKCGRARRQGGAASPPAGTSKLMIGRDSCAALSAHRLSLEREAGRAFAGSLLEERGCGALDPRSPKAWLQSLAASQPQSLASVSCCRGLCAARSSGCTTQPPVQCTPTPSSSRREVRSEGRRKLHCWPPHRGNPSLAALPRTAFPVQLCTSTSH